jgi:hypothetical protein
MSVEGSTAKLKTRMNKLGDVAKYHTDLLVYLRESRELELKTISYLLVSHAAGLVACVSVLKDYNSVAQLRGLGVFIWIFGLGLIAAIVAFVCHVLNKELVVMRIEDDENLPDEISISKFFRAVSFLTPQLASGALLVIAIAVTIYRFGSL